MEGSSDAKLIEMFPTVIESAINAINERLAEIRSEAYLVREVKNRDKERNEIMVEVTQELANISTVLGSDGENLKVLTFNDPMYLKSILVECDENAFANSIKNMTDEERLIFEKKMAKAGIVL